MARVRRVRRIDKKHRVDRLVILSERSSEIAEHMDLESSSANATTSQNCDILENYEILSYLSIAIKIHRRHISLLLPVFTFGNTGVLSSPLLSKINFSAQTFLPLKSLNLPR